MIAGRCHPWPISSQTPDKKSGPIKILLIIILAVLLTPAAQAVTINDYPNFPKGFSNFNLGVLSPVIEDVDPNSAGYEIVAVKNQGSDTVLQIYYSNGTYTETVFPGVRSYSSPATADLDGNSSNGLEIIFSRGTSSGTLGVYYSNLTPFWSVSLSGEGTTPAIGDIESDGKLEIIIGEGSKIGVYNRNSTQRFNYSLGTTTSSAPALADIDNDGYLEIIAADNNGDIYAINENGTLLWSYSTGNQISSSAPAVGDLDNDGDLEVVVATQSGVYAFYGNGTLMSGWPKSIAISTSSPALGDIDSDGDLEIVIGEGLSGDSRLVAWHYNGSALFQTAMDSFNILSSPVLADLDGDSLAEVVVGYNNKAWAPKLSIVNGTGSILNTESLSAVVSGSSPAVGDVDGDGKAEIVVTTEGASGKIHVLTTDGDYNVESAPWPMYRRSGRRTGMHSPVANISLASQGTYRTFEIVTLNGSGLSIDGALNYSWYSSLDGNFGNGSSLSGAGILSVGLHSVWLRATDPVGRFDDSVNITINVTNMAPVSVNDSYAVDEDNTLNVSAPGVLTNDSDAENDSISASLVSGVKNGSLTLNSDGSFTYIPDQDFNGADSFTYRADDSVNVSGVANVAITISAVNDAPVAGNDSYSVDQDAILNVSAPGVLTNDSDAENDSISATLASGPGNGNLTLNSDGSFTYMPDAGFSGTDSFTYQANDSANMSTASKVTITVSSTTPPPSGGGDNGGEGFSGLGGLEEVVFVTNSVDLGLADDFLGYLMANNIAATVISAEEFTFEVWNNNRVIVVLGGPDALEGVGEIVQNILLDSEAVALRAGDSQAMFVKYNVYTDKYTHKQMVIVVAGSNRSGTQAAGDLFKADVVKKILS